MPDVGDLDRLVPGGEDNLVAIEVKPYTGATCDRPSFRTVASLAVRAPSRRKLLYSSRLMSCNNVCSFRRVFSKTGAILTVGCNIRSRNTKRL